MEVNKNNFLAGCIWGLAIGIPGAVAGGFIGFSFFGLYFFADTNKAKLLISLSAIIVFIIVFLISFFYWQGKEVGSKMLRIVIPLTLIILEFIFGFIILLTLNVYTKQVSPTSIITSSALSVISREIPGIYHVIADVKENSITCWCPYGAQCELCVEKERGHLTLIESSSSVLEVNPYYLEKNKPISSLVEGRTYNFTIEKKQVDSSQVYYYIVDFEPYGPTN